MTIWKLTHGDDTWYHIRNEYGEKTSHDNWECYELWELLLALGAEPVSIGNYEVIKF